MSTRFRVLAFVLALAVVFLAARGVGAVTDPVVDSATASGAEHGEDHEQDREQDHEQDHEEGHEADAALHAPGGLQTSEQGYTLRVLGQDPLRLVVDGPDGHAVEDFDVVHDRPLHLVVVGRDGSGYQHLHPELADDGVWSVDAGLDPGTTRVIADFTPSDGPALVLGTDVQRAGTFTPAPPPEPSRVDRVGRYEVELAGGLVAGESSPVTATITRDGVPVDDLAPYLGAYGHLVALREGDLGYLHVHPQDAGPGPEVPFLVEVPSAGRYRLHLDFRHDGVVRTASFTVEATTEEGSHEPGHEQ